MLKVLRKREQGKRIPGMHALYKSSAYNEIMTRMYNPLVAGYSKVGTMAWLLAEFEPYNPFDDLFPLLPKELHNYAREEGLRMFNASLEVAKDDIHTLAVDFLRKPNKKEKKMSWNATCGESLTTNLATYFDLTLSEWRKLELPNYKLSLLRNSEITDQSVRDELANYVCEFVGTAMANVPYFLSEEANYYDSHTDEDPNDIRSGP